VSYDLYNLISQAVTLALVIYFGLHLRTQVRTLKSTVDVQEKAIAAQAEHMKTLQATIEAQGKQITNQSTVLQDFDRLNQLMKRVMDTVGDPAALERERAYRARVERDTTALLEQQSKELTQKGQQAVQRIDEFYFPLATGALVLIALMLPYVPPDVRSRLIEESDLDPPLKRHVQDIEHNARLWGFATGEWLPIGPSLPALVQSYLEREQAHKAQVDPS
jgi:hypothetical protein